mgnify:CR=1 FL=1|tara:strand:- start:1495 stop:4350 length:2856 start_codon:yes stop_codon:yes gene_type:complete
MTAVTQRVSNYLGGVSRQSDDKKLVNQVRECLNGYPDPTFGLTKRPGFKWIANLGTGTTYDSSKWFYIHRDNNEKYIGCIKPALIAVTGNGTSGATTKTNLATTTSGSGSGLTVDLTASSGVVTEIKINTAGTGYASNDTITIASSAAGTGANVTGTLTLGDIDIWNAATGTVCTVNYGTGAQAYLTGARTNYDILTVQDTSIVTNNLIPVTKLADPTFITKTRATLILSDTAVSSDYSVTLNAGGGASDQTFNVTSTSSETYETLLTKLKNGIDALSISGLTVTKHTVSLELSRVVSGTRTAFSITARGGAANNKLTVFQDQVDNVSQLPYNSFQDHVVKVINTASDNDTYFAKFVADDGVSGIGHWEETLDPSKSAGLNQDTMPHELINNSTNTFTFQKITWVPRKVGDDTTNSHPSFLNGKIEQAFFHNNRLGFLSKDNVSMSQSKDFYNLYHTSAQTVTDADPVDLSCSSIKPAALHGVIPTTQGLVLFSRNQQFLMNAADGILTPTSTTISTISSYEMDHEVDPVDMGTNINFLSKTPSYTRVFGMVTRGQDENPQVIDVGRVVNEWVPATIDTFIASPQNQFLALSSQSDRKVYFYRTYNDGEKNLVEAWFNWQLPGTVQGMAVDSDDMFAVTKQGNQFTLSRASLSQSPDDAIIVNNDGQRINPCMDLYSNARNAANNATVVWDSANEFSKCYIPFANVTTLTPVIVIKGTTATGQFIESGFTVTPEVITDDGDPYFKVPKKNLTSVAADVIVGWKYDLDIILPKTYYRTDENMLLTDYTANLTVARMKFAVGLSGVMGFKLKSTGSRQGKKEYTGDNSTTVFNWTQEDLDYIDKDQIKVTLDGVTTTAFTVSGDTQITFSSAPGTNVKILIYLDEWYNLNPTQIADTYLANDIALSEQSVFSIPIHQKTSNFQLRIFNDSPFPVSLNSMMWEGNYSPRFYRRA